ncbi:MULTISPECIES: translation elongation factor 4 [Pseudothermotoga]|uniref:Elongation factor 4 n=1 Tax=Pseudothermotoga lettingae (strain ATCC BAA-301 / DSM 14385 / NBRC 107922 / TMO) TaxID=416591 RepID=A8F3S7_PSELT|nr:MULTISPECIES: translation elongation factor 4 [Pseudothermotoga]ABV32811.1 GTP-binding protein LepA [Pseudothermotoga lettingae TMO]KUK21516.1 MAG: Elongation factor 4 [Pseudothermotoga lettingae]MDI3495134.1 GTP-binding protein LepA [Pseudothermotoga sp.]MDK2885178.1 GTP-binding protein LepA [Pseudothermotoga sp.]GLI48193.1 elongation factor 4 [Pseudothermotoga lettingae TMO]
MKDVNLIRNICIIAHIDHGKTTLVDRILELTKSVDPRQMHEQFLDQMDIERERGITIKAQPVKILYQYKEKEYEINIIDTPGHVDFSYEVSRSMAACEGAILLVDASQGVEAQTVAHTYLAIENDLDLVAAVNKIDLPNANVDETCNEIIDLIGIDSSDILKVSAKTGQGVENILNAIIEKVKPPKGDVKKPLKALIFDAKYDKYRGVIVYVRIFDGSVKKGDEILVMSTGDKYEVIETGIFTPLMKPTEELGPGEVGYIIAGIKEVGHAKVGDTITNAAFPSDSPLPGYKEIKPMVYASMFSGLPEYYEELKKSLEKLKLNDWALFFEPTHSPALGFGFRCGFLGLLHMDIVRERLEREYEIAVILTAPNVEYKILLSNGNEMFVNDPAKFPDEDEIQKIYEPFVKLSIITPSDYVGDIFTNLQNERRANLLHTENAGKNRVIMYFKVPLAEIITDFFDRLKAISHGYASMDYEFLGYEESDVVKISILINKEPVDALSTIVHKSKAYIVAKKLVDKLSELIPRHQFEIPIQAKAYGRIIARADIKALRKDVLAKCYGGDVTRKMKLLEKQKEGKKKLREIGQVSIPQEAFLAVLRIDEEKH